MILGDLLGRWGRAWPDKEALVDVPAGRRYTYGRLSARVYQLANLLQEELGICRGDRVACLAFNRAEYIQLFFALERLGAILVPLNFRLAGGEYAYFLEDAAPKAFFFDREHQDRVESLKSGSPVERYVCFDDDDRVGLALPRCLNRFPVSPPSEEEIGPEEPVLIIYTSGTTGDPKGVVLTQGMITWNGINTNLGWDLSSKDKTILHAAMFYTAGWNVFTLPLFQCRGTNIILRSFDPDLIQIGRAHV